MVSRPASYDMKPTRPPQNGTATEVSFAGTTIDIAGLDRADFTAADVIFADSLIA